MPMRCCVSLALMASTMLGSVGPAAASDPLEAYRGKSRVLLVSAASPEDPQLATQRKAFVAMQDGARARALDLVEAIGQSPKARALRERFGIDPGRFKVVLIGKDGGAKLDSDAPLGPEVLFQPSTPCRCDATR